MTIEAVLQLNQSIFSDFTLYSVLSCYILGKLYVEIVDNNT